MKLMATTSRHSTISALFCTIIKTQDSFEKKPYKNEALFRKRSSHLGSQYILATPIELARAHASFA